MNISKKFLHFYRYPLQLWLGLFLILVFWVLNWSLPGLRTHWVFFPLWLGYVLFIDGLVFIRSNTSLLTRSWKSFILLFIISAPAWWLFELINLRTQNWSYIGRHFFTNLEYATLATISFSTVMPAVFGTAELISTYNWFHFAKHSITIQTNRKNLLLFFCSGWIMLICLLSWPRFFFPLVWISVYFILEPLNVWLGNRSLAYYTRSGNWQPVFSLWTGALICGFFWEMWNFFAFPKWVYHVPFFDFCHIFEMPILGYGGYLPFALELFALYHLIIGIFKTRQISDYLRLSSPQK